MRGLMYKNFFQFRRMLMFLAVFGLLISFLIIWITSNMEAPTQQTDKMGIMLVMSGFWFVVFFCVGMMYSDLFLQDENLLNASFCISLPQSLKGHIKSKYYMILAINVIIMFMCFVTDTIVVAIMGDTEISAVGICVFIFCFQLLLAAVEIPFMVRFGASYGLKTLDIAVTVVLIFATVYFLFGDVSFLMSDDPGEALRKMMLAFVEKFAMILALLPYVTGILYYVSYRVSLALFRKGMENFEQ